MWALEFAPHDLDVVEFGGIFGEPFDGEPVRAGGECGAGRLADVDRAVIENNDDRLGGIARLWSVGGRRSGSTYFRGLRTPARPRL